jgi:carnosine N-methyltransferase
MTAQASEAALTLLAFLAYSKETAGEVSRVSRNFQRLSEADKQWLGQGEQSLLAEEMKRGISVNQKFFHDLVSRRLLSIDALPQSIAPEELVPYSKRVRQLLMALVREWTEDGAEERAACFGTISELLLKHLTKRPCSVLMPGGSMGRGALELAKKVGDECEVTVVESDLMKSLVFKYLTVAEERSTICPYILNTCNRRRAAILGKTQSIPDDLDILQNSKNSVQFVTDDVFQWATEETRKFDVIVTSFFLDACDTSIAQLTRIFSVLLNPNGLWINFGSLCYDDSTSSIYEASAEEVLLVVSRAGFDLVEHGFKKTTYCANRHSLMSSELDAMFFVARKL